MFKESDYLVALQAATRLFDGDERKAVDWLGKVRISGEILLG